MAALAIYPTFTVVYSLAIAVSQASFLSRAQITGLKSTSLDKNGASVTRVTTLQSSHSQPSSHAPPTAAIVRFSLSDLWRHQGCGRVFSDPIIDSLYRFLGFGLLIIGVPLGLYRELFIGIDAAGLLTVVVTMVCGLTVLTARTRIPLDNRGVMLALMLLGLSLAIALRTGSLGLVGVPLGAGLMVMFLRHGSLHTLAATVLFSISSFALLQGDPRFSWSSNLLAYGLSLSSAALLIGLVRGLECQIMTQQSDYERDRQHMIDAREDHHREVALLTQELRAPISAIFMLTQADSLNEQNQSDIKGSVDQLEQFASDIYALSDDAERLPVVRSARDLASLVFDISQQMHPLMTTRKIDFILNVDERETTLFEMDSLRTRGVLLNLCRFGLFLPDTTAIEVDVEIARSAPNHPTLRYLLNLHCDAEIAATVLHGFSNAAAINSREELAVRELLQSKQWCTDTSGSLELKTTMTGLTIEAQIPLSELSHDKDREDAAPLAQLLHGQRVLVVDDDPLTRRATAILLRNQFGASVEEAGSGNEGWELFQRHNYALVFTDFFMPDGDGLGLIRRVRRVNPVVPIVAATATALPGDVVALTDEGANLVLPKPLSSSEVQKALTNLAEHSVQWGRYGR